MDLGAHVMYGVTICSRAGLAGGEKGTAGRRWYREATVWWAVLFGILPDVVSMWVPFFVHVASGKPGIFFHYYGGGWLEVYRWMHSLVIALAFSGTVFLLRRRMFVASLAWALHVVCDAVSHSAGKFQTFPFYPFSDWGVNGIPFWRNPWFVLTYWAVLAVIWIGLIVWRWRVRKKMNSGE